MTEDVRLDFYRVDDQGKTTWVVNGPAGAVTLAAMVWPPVLTAQLEVEDSALLRDWVRTDAGWLVPSELGTHHRAEPEYPEAYSFEEDCPFTGFECWYGGSSLGAYRPLKTWEQAGFDDRYLEKYLCNRYEGEFHHAQ